MVGIYDEKTYLFFWHHGNGESTQGHQEYQHPHCHSVGSAQGNFKMKYAGVRCSQDRARVARRRLAHTISRLELESPARECNTATPF